MPKSKDKKLPESVLDKIIENEANAPHLLEYSLGDEILEIEVKPVLSLEECMRLVSQAAAECADENEGGYFPELLEYVFRRYVLAYYANLVLPADHNKAYKLLFETGLFYQVRSHVDTDQYEALYECVIQKVSFLNQRILRHTKGEEALDILHGILERIDKALDAQAIAQAVSNLTNAYSAPGQEQENESTFPA